jgi:hypothetical protein
MSPVRGIQGSVAVKRSQELDGSWVICADQHIYIKRTSSNDQQVFTCELVTDDLPYSSFSAVIVVNGNFD